MVQLGEPVSHLHGPTMGRVDIRPGADAPMNHGKGGEDPTPTIS